MSRDRHSGSVVEADTLDSIPLEHVHQLIESSTFCCIRGLVTRSTLSRALERITARFDHRNDHPAAGQPPDAVRHNFQKLNVGGERRTAANDDARLFRAFYNPLWDEDIYGLRETFATLARVRNRIAELPPEFALDRIEANGLWTAARFHQYPRGGGFFRRHTDYVVKDVAQEKSTNFYQILLTMTQKGDDFETGGAFVDVDGERIFLDDFSRPGDIIIYDGRTVHGVEEIDPHIPLDLTTVNGRLAGFATLFKKM